MKTLSQYIEHAKKIMPNSYDNDVFTQWINEVEGHIQAHVMLIAKADMIEYNYTEDEDTELLVDIPYNKIYYTYLFAMICFANGEYGKYNNTISLYNSFLSEYSRWYANTVAPANGEAIDVGYYISAYGLAVKHGYEGTEEEWIVSLKGETGDTGISIENIEIEEQENGNLYLKITLDNEDVILIETNIKGDKGETGESGVYVHDSETPLDESTLPEDIKVVIDTYADAYTMQQFIDLASEATTGASTASDKATESKSYAIGGTGERENEDTDNSKYYSEQAETSAQTATTKATEASGYADTAGEKAIDSESYAVGGTNSRIGEDTDNASYYATQAGASAQTASEKATEAGGYATTATNKATEAKSYAVGGTATRENEETDNAYYYAATASEEAITAANKATESKSYAVGGTSTRTGEDTDNAKYYSEQATATLASKADKAQGEWIAPTLSANWTGTVEYRKNQFGKVELRGEITRSEGTFSAAWTMPIGYRTTLTVRQTMCTALTQGLPKVSTLSHSNHAFFPGNLIGETVDLSGFSYYAEA